MIHFNPTLLDSGFDTLMLFERIMSIEPKLFLFSVSIERI